MTAPQRTDTSFWLVVLVAVLCNVGTLDPDMPLKMLNGENSDPNPMADAAEHGSLLRPLVLIVFAALGLGVLRRAGAGWPRPSGWLGWLSLTMLAWNCLSYLWADSPDIVGRRIGGLVLSAVGAYGISRLEAKELRLLLTAIVLSSILFGFTNELLLGTFRPFSPDYRFAGMSHPNFQAWNDAILVLLAISWLPEPDIRGVTRIALLGTGLFFLFLTNSRTSFISLMAAAGFWYAARSAVTGVSAVRPVIICVALLASVALLLHGAGLLDPGSIAQSVLGAERDEGDITSLTGRLDVWAACLRAAGDRWPFGFGFDGFWTPARITQISDENQWGINQAHSAYIDVILTTGVVGLTLFVATLCLGIAAALRHFRQDRSDTALMAASLLVFAAIHGATESIVLAPALTGATFSMILIARLGFGPHATAGKGTAESPQASGALVGQPGMARWASRRSVFTHLCVRR